MRMINQIKKDIGEIKKYILMRKNIFNSQIVIERDTFFKLLKTIGIILESEKIQIDELWENYDEKIENLDLLKKHYKLLIFINN